MYAQRSGSKTPLRARSYKLSCEGWTEARPGASPAENILQAISVFHPPLGIISKNTSTELTGSI